METFMAVFATVCYIGFIILVLFGFKWVLAIITILMGDKQSLQDFGNLCAKSPPPKTNWKYYEQKEKEIERRWLEKQGYDWRSKDSF
jgi:hypothetical protein